MERKIIVAPSVLSANFAAMGEAVKLINNTEAPWIHFDVMDGSFVPPITFGAQMIKDMRPFSQKLFDVHLMVNHPETQVESMAAAGADLITIHQEATTHLHKVLSGIRETGIKSGISLVPSTPVSAVEEVLHLCDLVLVMTVNPGYGGQKFIPQMLKKINKLKEIREEFNYNYLIEVDGGVNLTTYRDIIHAGADVLVTGSAFFGAENPGEFVKKIEQGG